MKDKLFRRDTMENTDYSDPEQIRSYLKENMAEGYLSQEEGSSIDEFVDEYSRLLQIEENLDQIMRETFEAKVQ